MNPPGSSGNPPAIRTRRTSSSSAQPYTATHGPASDDEDLHEKVSLGIHDRPITPRFHSDGAFGEAWARGKWLLGLLMLQSLSSVVLQRYEELIENHIVITLFLTMLVGAGGNAGNQAAISVIRGLATGQLNNGSSSIQRCLAQQAMVGSLLSSMLAVAGFLRVFMYSSSLTDAIAITLSLVMIVMSSVLLGTLLPFALSRAGWDPANAGTTIQVLMDILGVLWTCATCDIIFHIFMHSSDALEDPTMSMEVSEYIAE